MVGNVTRCTSGKMNFFFQALFLRGIWNQMNNSFSSNRIFCKLGLDWPSKIIEKVLERFNGSYWIWPPTLYNVDRSHVDNFFVAPLNIVWWGWGGIWVEEGFKLHAHYCLKNTVCLKLALYLRKTKSKNGSSVPTHFFQWL